MTRSNRLLMVGMVVLIIGAVPVLRTAGQPPAAVEDGQFSANAVLIMGEKDAVAVLESPTIRILGGRAFFVGTEQKENNFVEPTFDGAIIWVPVDEATKIVELK